MLPAILTRDMTLCSALLQAQMETSLDGILCVDEDGRILSFNKRFVELWRIPREVLATRSDRKALQSVLDKLSDPAGFLARVRHLYAHREERSHDELFLRDGRVFDRYSAPVLGPGREFLGRIWYFRDITERKRSEQALAERSKELARVNEELKMFVTAASTEMAKPLRTLVYFSGLLRRRYGDWLSPAACDLVERINDAAVRLSTLVQDTLMLSRVGRKWAPRGKIDLDKLVEEVQEDLRERFPLARARFVNGPLPTVLAEPGLMRQLFQELFANAIKFRKEGHAPRVTVASRLRSDGWCEIDVTDDGIGFDPRAAERIFEPFTRLNLAERFPGTGIGLAICRRIVQGYGGRITAESIPKQGATFTVSLPPEMLA